MLLPVDRSDRRRMTFWIASFRSCSALRSGVLSGSSSDNDRHRTLGE